MLNDHESEIFHNSIENLRNQFKISRKKAEQQLISFVYNPRTFNELLDSLQSIKAIFSVCEQCSGIMVEKKCSFCSDALRNHKLICVVENYSDALNIAKTGLYNGNYHILTGLMSLKKPFPQVENSIEKLLQRISETTEEVIIALSATMEGEMTIELITTKIRSMFGGKLKISTLARGIPMGGSLDYIDDHTLKASFKNRK